MIRRGLFGILGCCAIMGCGGGGGDSAPPGAAGAGTTTGDTVGAASDTDATVGDTATLSHATETEMTVVTEECADFPWEVTVEQFNMLILLDRSASMVQNNIDTQTYADVVQQAIEEIVETNTRSGLINFALNVFPSPAQCTDQYRLEHSGPNQIYEDVEITCQAASQFDGDAANPGDPVVPFSAMTAEEVRQKIKTELDKAGQCGGTPICKSLEWARAWLQKQEQAGTISGRTFVLLATDGAPNCNPNLNHAECISTLTGQQGGNNPQECLDDVCAYNAAYQLVVAGYRTFVIGVGEDVEAYRDVLDTIAYWGGGYSTGSETSATDIQPAPDGDWYFPAKSAAQLTSALEDITNEAVSCNFTIDWSTIPDRDPLTGREVQLRCDAVNVLGVLNTTGDTDSAVAVDTDTDSATDSNPDDSLVADNAGKIVLTYARDCASETADAPAWQWDDPGLKNQAWGRVIDAGEDLSQCTRIHLCPHACSKLKVKQGFKEWTAVSARFGCKPELILE